MKLSPISYALMTALSITFAAHSYAVEIVDKGSTVPTERDTVDNKDTDTPWSRRMEDVTGLFGVKVVGEATSEGNLNSSTNFNTFQPWQQSSFEAVGAYGSTQVGFGCDGINLGSIIDGQLGQYAGMVEEFISQAPTLAIMYLAYSQPAVKSVIDEMNMVGQFGLDLSNMTCSGVRALADKSYEEKKQALAEAECTADAGYKDPNCFSGTGLQSALMSTMQTAKQQVTQKTTSLFGAISSGTGGFIKSKSAAAGGATSGGTGTGTAPGTTPGTAPAGSVTGKNCSGVDTSGGTTPLILGASELGCTDIKKYSRLIPSYVIQDNAEEVVPRSISVEDMSKEITNEHMDLLKKVYESDWKTFTQTDAYQSMVNRADIVITKQELLFMQEMAKKNPALAIQAQRQLATLSMMKELEIIISKIEIGVESGLSNQIEGEHLSDRTVSQYGSALRVLRLEYELLQKKIEADQKRSAALNNIASTLGK